MPSPRPATNHRAMQLIIERVYTPDRERELAALELLLSAARRERAAREAQTARA